MEQNSEKPFCILCNNVILHSRQRVQRCLLVIDPILGKFQEVIFLTLDSEAEAEILQYYQKEYKVYVDYEDFFIVPGVQLDLSDY